MEKKVHFNIGKYAVIILAAGSSSRLGAPKQLLSYNNKTLLQHAVDAATQLERAKVIVVLGSNKEQIAGVLDGMTVTIVENTEWKSGIASSIRTGLKAAESLYNDIDAVMLLVCDQPFVSADLLNQLLISQMETGKALIGCTYDDTKGTPALFHRSLFPELLSLSGDSGAKKLFEKYKASAYYVPFNRGGIDIDTSEDYQNLPK